MYTPASWSLIVLTALAGFAIGAAAAALRNRRIATAPRPCSNAPFADWHRYVLRLVASLRRARGRATPPAAAEQERALADARDTLGAHPLRDDLRRLAERLETVPGADAPQQAAAANLEVPRPGPAQGEAP